MLVLLELVKQQCSIFVVSLYVAIAARFFRSLENINNGVFVNVKVFEVVLSCHNVTGHIMCM